MQKAISDLNAEAIKLAHEARGNLIPIIGAGTSIPLGLPSWSELVERLSPPSGPIVKKTENAADYLMLLQQALGKVEYTARIRSALRLPEYTTSTTLQAIVSSNVPKIITTNLDYGLEIAYAKAGSPLHPESIGRGYSAEDLSLFDTPSSLPVLLKIHGSLERPSSWVLTSEEYDKAYQDPGLLKLFLQTKAGTPLFIGFSFSDFDLGQSLRLGRIRWSNKAFAILHQEQAASDIEKLKTLGVISIPVSKFDQIPEVIDEIFKCQPLKISYQKVALDKSAEINIGAASISLTRNGITYCSCEEEAVTPMKILANALELQPNKSYLEDKQRRQHETKGRYREMLQSLILKRDIKNINVVLQGLAQYPEILLSGVVDFFLELKNEGFKDDEYFFLFDQLFKSLRAQYADVLEILKVKLLSNLHNATRSYYCLRGISKVLSNNKLHPGLHIPPDTVQVGDFKVPIYPLTEGQVAALNVDSKLNELSVKPYIINKLKEANDLIQALRKLTGEDWRLPTESEWRHIAGLSEERCWPWGNELPEYRTHAHLKYADRLNQVPKHPLEVGIFPRGGSVDGIMDLVGNVHELVVSDNHESKNAFAGVEQPYSNYKLAGGAWSSKITPSWQFRMLSGLGKPSKNTGIRPIVSNKS